MRLHDDLSWDDSDPKRPIVLYLGEPVASFESPSPHSLRVLASLEFLGGRRRVDVTVQPETIVHLLRRLAAHRNADSSAWQRAVRSKLLASASEWGITEEGLGDEPLGVVLAALGFPLVRFARLRGVMSPPYVPRWAEPILMCPDVRSAASVAFPHRATRRVARELPASLIGATMDGNGGGDPASPRRAMLLVPLALALALPDSAPADVVANVLSSPTADHAPHHWPSVDDIELLRRGFAMVGVDAAAQLSREAMISIEGPDRLVTMMVHVPRLMSAGAGSCPRRLADLEAAVTAFTSPVVEVRRRVAAHRDGAAINIPVNPLNAQPLRREVERRDEFQYPDSVKRLHGAASGAYSLRLPRTRDELRAWGRELHNCMNDYSDNVACHRSVVLGLLRGERLVAGVELSHDLRRVRQFVRDDNERPWLAQRNALREILGHLGVGGG